MEKQLSYSYNEVLEIVQGQKHKDFWISAIGTILGFILGFYLQKQFIQYEQI